MIRELAQRHLVHARARLVLPRRNAATGSAQARPRRASASCRPSMAPNASRALCWWSRGSRLGKTLQVLICIVWLARPIRGRIPEGPLCALMRPPLLRNPCARAARARMRCAIAPGQLIVEPVLRRTGLGDADVAWDHVSKTFSRMAFQLARPAGDVLLVVHVLTRASISSIGSGSASLCAACRPGRPALERVVLALHRD